MKFEPLKAFSATIFKLNKEQFNYLLKKHENGEKFSCEEKLCFLLSHDDGTFTAVENSTGDMFCEDFKTKTAAYIFLADLQESEPLQAAEKIEEWY